MRLKDGGGRGQHGRVGAISVVGNRTQTTQCGYQVHRVPTRGKIVAAGVLELNRNY